MVPSTCWDLMFTTTPNVFNKDCHLEWHFSRVTLKTFHSQGWGRCLYMCNIPVIMTACRRNNVTKWSLDKAIPARHSSPNILTFRQKQDQFVVALQVSCQCSNPTLSWRWWRNFRNVPSPSSFTSQSGQEASCSYVCVCVSVSVSACVCVYVYGEGYVSARNNSLCTLWDYRHETCAFWNN